MRLVIAVVAICLAVLFLSPLLIPLITEMEVVTEKIECVAGNETGACETIVETATTEEAAEEDGILDAVWEWLLEDN